MDIFIMALVTICIAIVNPEGLCDSSFLFSKEEPKKKKKEEKKDVKPEEVFEDNDKMGGTLDEEE